MDVGAEVSILPLELAETACAEAGVKWNPPRQKRAGQRGKIAEVTEGGAKAKVTFEDEIKDPDSGAVVRTDTQTLLFPVTALQSVDAAGEAAQAQMQDALASASAKVAAATAEVASLRAEKETATAALQAQVDALAKAEEKQKLKVQRLQKELAGGLKAADSAGTTAAAAQEERRAALERAERAEATVVTLERRVQMVMEAAQGGQSAKHHCEVSGDETVRAHDVYEITLEVTEQHIYGSGGVSVCYQFDVQAFDLSFGIWLKRTGADVLSHGEEVVMMSEKFEAGTTVKDELAVTHPGSYILRWDNTHSRMRGKQVKYKCSIRTDPARAAVTSMLGGFEGAEEMPPLRPNTPAAAPAPAAAAAADADAEASAAAAAASASAAAAAADRAALVQCQAELVGSREELAKEKAENASLKVSLAEATAKVTSLEAAQATAKAAVEAAAKDFDVPDFDDIPDFDD